MVCGVDPCAQDGDKAGQAAVAHGDCDIAAQAVEAGAPHRRTIEELFPLRLFECGQPLERGIYQFAARLKIRVGGDGRLAIPWADVLADVAAEDLAADGGTEVVRDGTALLDGEVGDTEGRIHLARGEIGIGGGQRSI